jgi:hypothetical protein
MCCFTCWPVISAAQNTFTIFGHKQFLKMDKNKRGFDVVNEVLEECILAYPVSSFVISLYKQYRERGSLSKKQLQGLYGKASKINEINPGKLATLEALINKMPTRDKTQASAPKPAEEKDETAKHLIDAILQKYPQHKRVLYLQAKYNNNEVLSTVEISDLKRFAQLLK